MSSSDAFPLASDAPLLRASAHCAGGFHPQVSVARPPRALDSPVFRSTWGKERSSTPQSTSASHSAVREPMAAGCGRYLVLPRLPLSSSTTRATRGTQNESCTRLCLAMHDWTTTYTCTSIFVIRDRPHLRLQGTGRTALVLPARSPSPSARPARAHPHWKPVNQRTGESRLVLTASWRDGADVFKVLRVDIEPDAPEVVRDALGAAASVASQVAPAAASSAPPGAAAPMSSCGEPSASCEFCGRYGRRCLPGDAARRIRASDVGPWAAASASFPE